MADLSYRGLGQAFVVGSKCNKLIPFTSSYNWTWSGDADFDLGKIEYNGSGDSGGLESAYNEDTNQMNQFVY